MKRLVAFLRDSARWRVATSIEPSGPRSARRDPSRREIKVSIIT